MHHEFDEIAQLIDYALNAPHLAGKGMTTVGLVSPELAELITRSIQVETLGFRLTVDHSSILHTLRKHGDAETEKLRGQLPITTADVLALGSWLSQPNFVADAGQKPGEPRCLRFVWEHKGESTTAIMSVRLARHKTQLP